MLCAGQVYRSQFTVGDGSVAAATATLVITRPDGTVEPNVVPVNSPQGSGFYYYDYLLPTMGLYQFAWSSTGPGTAPPPVFENVRVYRSIVSPAEMKQHLNITTTADDDELAAFMMAGTELVESKVGACAPAPYVDRIEQGTYRLLVMHKPILSVTSVTSVWPGGPAWQASQLRWDAEAGIVDQIMPFPFWWPPWDVAYLSGRQVIPERFIHAAKEQVRHLWDTQRGSMAPALLQGEEVFTTTTGFTFSVPRRVLELLEQDMVPSS